MKMLVMRALLGLAATLAWGSGHAQDAAASAAADRTLQGDARCTRCHDQSETRPVLSIYQTRHGVKADTRTPGCQSCHGASVEHVNNEKDTDPRPPVERSFGKKDMASTAEQTQACLACHRGGQRGHWDGSQHQAANLPCSTCHRVHVPRDPVLAKATQAEVCFACHKSERAQTHRVSTHPLAAGKMGCSDCHNPHGSTGPKLQRKGSVNETCYSCHAEKRGPFLWEHQPATEDCSTCHTPHGSNIAPLLKLRTPYMCQACHTGDHAAQINSAANLARGQVTTAKGYLPLANAPQRAQVAGRNCLSCHSLVHGSNHPAGAKLNR